MKIGIFGDSFAQPNKLNTTDTWVDILSKKYDITNHAVGGSNLYYSINEIKQHHSHYDKIILIVTEPGRLKIADWIPIDKNELYKLFVVGLTDPTSINQDNKTSIESAYLEASKQYFTYLQDTEYDIYIHNLMLKDISEYCPNIILIPGFENSWNNLKESAMVQIFLKENEAWELDWKFLVEKFIDCRNCHMTAENNQIFAIKAEQWLNGEPVQINLDDFVTTTNKDFYLTKL